MTIEEQFGDWYELLEDYLKTEEFKQLGFFINERNRTFNTVVSPLKDRIFKAFRECPLEKLKVVFIGNQPYDNPIIANGLAYGINNVWNTPPCSNYELERYVESEMYDGLNLHFDNSLISLANQGTLWLNTSLTTENIKPELHSEKWKNFIEYLSNKLAEEKVAIIYVFMTKESKKLLPLLNKHKVNFPIDASEEDKLLGVFSKINEILTEVAKGLDIDPSEYIIKW